MSRRLTLAVAAAIAAPLLASSSAAPLGAQTNVSDPVLRHIWALGMDSSHTWDLSQVLFDSIGPRLTGTPAGTNASDWVMKMYRSWGIDAKREQYGTWRGWKRGPSHVDMMKPFVRSLEAVTEGYSPGTGRNDRDSPNGLGQRRIREVAAPGEGKARADFGRLSHVPPGRGVGGDGDA
jgi:carboxypeptidase Q